MCLTKLDIYNVRNIQRQSFEPSPGINLIYGENGSGKSSVLEAIYILGRAKSFRSPTIKTVINTQEKHLLVAGQLNGVRLAVQQLGIQMDSKSIEIRINRESSNNRSDLAYALPLQLIHPKSYELLDAGPQQRREFLDWGVFNHERKFLPAWRNFKRALFQRNALLKMPRCGQLHVWDKELAYYGTIVNRLREGYLLEFLPVFIEIARQFLELGPINLSLAPGWDGSKNLQEVLLEDQEKDLRYGFTHSGPHRADLQLMLNHRLAKDFVSRGHLKLLVLSLKLAQVKVLAQQQGHAGCILIDDFSAELDKSNRLKLLGYLNQMNCQAFITATDPGEFRGLDALMDCKLFHMEHGKLNPVSVPHGTINH